MQEQELPLAQISPTAHSLVLAASLASEISVFQGWASRKALPAGARGALTQENDDAGQDGDERACAQAGVQDVGLSVAGEQRPVHVAPADPDGEGVGATHGWDATIADHDGKEVQILLLPTEAPMPGIHPRGVICGKRGDRVSSGNRAIFITACRISGGSSHGQG